MSKSPHVFIGIDFGTTASCTSKACYSNGSLLVDVIANESGDHTTPSVVRFVDADTTIIGAIAEKSKQIYPLSTIHAVKRLLGRRYSEPPVRKAMQGLGYGIREGPEDSILIDVQLGDVTITRSPVDIAALIIESQVKLAGIRTESTITEAVLTVPAYCTVPQRTATIAAAHKAGLREVHLLDEPVASCLTYGRGNVIPTAHNVLVFDFGGGTLDVSVVEVNVSDRVFKVLSVAGDLHLGGEDVDMALFAYVQNVLKTEHNFDLLSGSKATRNKVRLLNACREAKILLSDTRSTELCLPGLLCGEDFSYTISRDILVQVCQDLRRKCKTVIDEALCNKNFRITDVAKVVLAGGSSNMLWVRELLTDTFGANALNLTVNPLDAISRGAAIYADFLQNKGGLQTAQIVTVASHGVGYLVNNNKINHFVCRNEPLPCSGERTTASAGAIALFTIFEGDSDDASACVRLRSHQINLTRQTDLTFKYTMTTDGLLHFEVTDGDTVHEKFSASTLDREEWVTVAGEEVSIDDAKTIVINFNRPDDINKLITYLEDVKKLSITYSAYCSKRLTSGKFCGYVMFDLPQNFDIKEIVLSCHSLIPGLVVGECRMSDGQPPIK